VGAQRLEDPVTDPLPDRCLADIRERLSAASSAPWIVQRDRDTLTRRVVSADGMLDANLGYLGNASQANARFIARAPADIRVLLAEVDRLRAEVQEFATENQILERALGLNEAA
jgi:hypothetical protein